MNTLEFVSTLIGDVVWPATLGMVVLWLSTSKLGRALASRVAKVRVGPVEAELTVFGKAGAADRPEIAESVSADMAGDEANLKTERFANFYWLGHDLEWTIDVLLRGGPVDVVHQGHRQSLFHLTEVGLGSTIPARTLKAGLKQLEDPAFRLDSFMRERMTRELAGVKARIGPLFNATQDGFRSRPSESNR